RARRGHVEQLAFEQEALLEQEVSSSIDVGRSRELGVEEQRDHIGPASLRELLPRRGEQARARLGRGLADAPRQRVARLRVVRVVLEDGEERVQVGHGVGTAPRWYRPPTGGTTASARWFWSSRLSHLHRAPVLAIIERARR